MKRLTLLFMFIFFKHLSTYSWSPDLRVSIEKLNDSTFQSKLNVLELDANLIYRFIYINSHVIDSNSNYCGCNVETIEDSCRTKVHTFKINNNLATNLSLETYEATGHSIQCGCFCSNCFGSCIDNNMNFFMKFKYNEDNLKTWSVTNYNGSFDGNIYWGNNVKHGPLKTIMKTVIDSIHASTCNTSRISVSFQTVGNTFDFPATVQLLNGNQLVGNSFTINSYNFTSFPISEGTNITSYKIIDNNKRLQIINFDTTIVIRAFAKAGIDKTICLKDSATIGISSNIFGYTYSWNPNIAISATNIAIPKVSPNSNTIYYLTVSNGLCISKDTIQINVKPIPIADAGRDTVSCFSQAIKLGTLPFPNATYFWYGETSGCGFGPFEEVKAQPLTGVTTKQCNFIVSVNLNGCVTRDTVNVKPIDYPDVINSSILQNDISLCGSQNIIGTLASPSYIQPYLNYVWTSPTGGILSNYNIATPFANTTNTNTQNTHRFIRTTSACNWSFKDSIDVTFKPLPNVNFTKNINGSNIQLFAPSGNSSYFWNFYDGFTSSLQNTIHTYNSSGLKFVTLVSYLNGCRAEKTDSFNIIISKINNKISFVESFKLYPNPTHNNINIFLKSEKLANFKINIYNYLGENVFYENILNSRVINKNIDVLNLDKGTYIINIESEGQIISSNFIIQ